eukprot:1355965-Amorphochlora_amoeboformis.AAC.1
MGVWVIASLLLSPPEHRSVSVVLEGIKEERLAEGEGRKCLRIRGGVRQELLVKFFDFFGWNDGENGASRAV